MQINPLLCVICDDVRIENNGKQIIIGIYTGKIIIPVKEFPSEGFPFFISLWIPFYISEAGSAIIEIKIEGLEDDFPIIKASNQNLTLHTHNELHGFAIQKIAIPIKKLNTELKISVRNVGESDWHILKELPIEVLVG